MKRARIQVDSHIAGVSRTTVTFVDLDIDPDVAAEAKPIVDRAIAAVDHPEAASLLLCLAVELFSDIEAYERECVRRGVLPV